MTLNQPPKPPGRTAPAAGYGAVIFDLDGVVTDTACLHAAAWKSLFDAVLPALPGTLHSAFDIDRDYRQFVDGRSREDGVRTFLQHRGISLPEGTADDLSDSITVNGLAARKQQIFATLLAGSGVKVFPDALALLHRLAGSGVPTALVTASRNSRDILASAGITGLFTVVVDGTDAVALSLPGKPDPAMFREAARRVHVVPADAVVLEDAVAGVQAGVSGGFALVVGVDRGANRSALLASGAHRVVSDINLLDLVRPQGTADPWLVIHEGFDAADEGRREALCTLGNGYWATRGSVPGSLADATHYPGTYFAGVYNRLSTDLAGRIDEAEHMVNAPDWTFLTVQPVGGPLLAPGQPELLGQTQELDLRHGILTRTNRYRDSAGRTTRIASRQFQSLAHPQLAVLETTVDAEDWSGEVFVVSTVNGEVANRNSAADGHLASHHLLAVGGSPLDDETVLWESRTTQSGISIAMAMRSRIHDESGARVPGLYRPLLEAGRAGFEITFALWPGRPVVISKTVAVATSRDRALSTAVQAASQRIRRAPATEALLAAHVRAWDELWGDFAIHLGAGRQQSQAMNVNIFHVLQTAAAAGPDLDAGLPARGLHGEGYRGHIFWDELFIYPMLTLRRPEMTRSLLLYRYRRLDEARAAARSTGQAGALFPWQSGSDGREETPTALFNVRDQQWMPDNSHRERHVGLAVAYNVWQYFQASGDHEFLATYGAEILVEVARFFAGLATPDPAGGRFSINNVMGPDEFHDGYPDQPGGGVRNNAYTNVMASWVLAKAREAVALVSAGDGGKLSARLALQPVELAHWDRVSRRLQVPFHVDGVISQFDGYEGLKEFDWAAYRDRYGDIGRLDLILQAEGDSTNGYKLSKQADVLMLFYLLSAEELREVFGRLGYPLPPDLVPRTINYYLARTSHGSTLSRLAHGWVLARSDREQSWSLFTQALRCDLADIPGGSTREGVHLGAMAGTSDMVLRCYGGVETRQDTLWLHPLLPVELPQLLFHLTFRGQGISVHLTTGSIALHLSLGQAKPIHVCVENVQRDLGPGDSLYMALESRECTVTRR